MRVASYLILTAFLSLTARAQSEAVPPRLDYRSVLADFAPYREAERADWRAANDTVGRLGGHMGHVQPQDPGPARGPGEAPASAASTRQGGKQP